MFGDLISGAVSAVSGLLGGGEEKQTQVVQPPQADYSGLLQPMGREKSTSMENRRDRQDTTEKADAMDPSAILGSMGNDPIALAEQWAELMRSTE